MTVVVIPAILRGRRPCGRSRRLPRIRCHDLGEPHILQLRTGWKWYVLTGRVLHLMDSEHPIYKTRVYRIKRDFANRPLWDILGSRTPQRVERAVGCASRLGASLRFHLRARPSLVGWLPLASDAVHSEENLLHVWCTPSRLQPPHHPAPSVSRPTDRRNSFKSWKESGGARWNRRLYMLCSAPGENP